MSLKEEAYKEIENLITRFEEQLTSYKKSDYNETLVRRDFIDPFFKALGWDVDNSQGYAEAYREVIHEDRVRVSGVNKAPDYSFRLPGGKRLFFVEAKKPSVYIKEDVLPAYQVRRYGWSAKLSLSIVTDFEEFALYDCIKKPSQTDKASTARIKYFTYKEYLSQFDFLWDTFSKERVLRGGLDKFVVSDKLKKGTTTVDKDFLNSLDEWRKELALNIALRNEVNNDELNFVVQALLDRLIFLRIAEDRNIETYGALKNCIVSMGGEKNVAYTRLLKLFTEADSKYNSGIFNFKQDKISKQLEIDNAALRKIIQQLYYPESPYEFSVINVEILGSAYEQFLGKQIYLKGTHKAIIEEKPEVRKAGGVYYTPQYIVDYIVDNTVGKLIENKTPPEVTKLKIVDPACGSGSFILGAYDKLLKWYHAYYEPEYKRLSEVAASTEYVLKDRNEAVKQRNKLPLTPDGRLTTTIKKQILLNNIYGVDIDANAVEVTKLSLLLKCLEDETQSSINAELRFGETVLPSLENNIRVGNSLIDVDFYEQYPDADTHAVKPFSWKDNFKDVFRNGGFDVVVGNPPWGAQFSKDLLSYLREDNKEIIVRMIDSFMYFVYKSFKLLKQDGSFGMILPDVLLYQNDNLKLRDYILKNTTIKIILNLGNVFEGVTRPSCIIVFDKIKLSSPKTLKTLDLTNIKKESKAIELLKQENYKTLLQQQLIEIPNYLFVTNNINHFELITKIKNQVVKNLSEFVDDDGIQRGVSPDLKEAFLITSQQAKHHNLEKDFLRDVLTGGKQVKRFYINYPDLKLIYTNRNTDLKTIPNIRNYINQFKSDITCMEVKEGKHSIYSLHRAREEKIFTKPVKLVGVITEDQVIVSLDTKKTFVTDGLYLFGVKNINIKYLMGVLNSKLFVFLYRLITMESGRVLAQVKPTVLNQLPIRAIEENNKKDKQLHDDILKFVDAMLQLNKQLQQTTLPQQQEQLKQRIAFTDKKIDALVYELYGLSEEEIKIVESQ